MHWKISKWLSVCLGLSALSSAMCVNTTAGTTNQPMNLEESKESRDVDVIYLASIMNECNETFRTEMAYIDSLNQSGIFPDETDKTAKCFVRCLLEQSGAVSAEGAVDRGRAPRFFAAAAERPPASADAFADSTDACSDRHETCPCERSYQFVKCVVLAELHKHDDTKTLD